MSKVLSVCLLACFAISCNAGKAPFITPCHVSDQACLLSSSQAAISHFVPGIPELGLPSSDPLVLDNVSADEGELSLQFRNTQVTGLKQCKFLSVVMTEEKHELALVLECPIKATGQYTVGGKLLVVPIEGDGDFEIKTERVKIIIHIRYSNIDGIDGQQHINIDSYDYEYELEEQFYFNLENLFGGNKEKAKPVLDILNQSWREVIKTFGKSIIEELVQKGKNNIQLFFHAIPTNELLLS